MKKYFYSIKAVEISSKEICQNINNNPKNVDKLSCYNYEGGGVYIQSHIDPKIIQKKIKQQLSIDFGVYQEIKT